MVDQNVQPRLEATQTPQGLRKVASDQARPGSRVVEHPQLRRGAAAVSWPPERSDVVALICFGLTIVLLCLGRSDGLVAFTIGCAVASGLSRRARRLVLRAGPNGVEAEIDLNDREDGSSTLQDANCH